MSSKRKHILASKISFQEYEEKYLRYLPLYLVSFSLPIKPMKVTVTGKNKVPEIKYLSKIELENGPCTLTMIADQDYGHPVGKDRLLIAWLFSQAVKTKSRYLYYSSIKKILEEMGLEYGKTNRDWLYAAVNRINRCFLQYAIRDNTICVTKNGHILNVVAGPLDPKRRKKQNDMKNELTIEERKKFRPEPAKFDQCYFELSEELFDNLMATAVPFDIRIINALGENYGAIDLYLFWSWRNYRASKEGEGMVRILLTDLQKHMTGAKNKRKFAQQMKERIALLQNTIRELTGESDRCLIEVIKNNILVITTTFPIIPTRRPKQYIQEPAKEIAEPEYAAASDDSDLKKKALEAIHKTLGLGFRSINNL